MIIPFGLCGLFLGLLNRRRRRGMKCLMFIVLQARCVGWKQNTGKTGMALLLRNERSDSSS